MPQLESPIMESVSEAQKLVRYCDKCLGEVRVSPIASSDNMPSASIPPPRPSSPLKLNVNFDK
ncbi:unnamed protein product, partial [Toxocara canis]|uniref:Ovule protein n=1 Tax=Toxocara canis TaxID=6265 RepID=A0A183U856_TOXCA